MKPNLPSDQQSLCPFCPKRGWKALRYLNGDFNAKNTVLLGLPLSLLRGKATWFIFLGPAPLSSSIFSLDLPLTAITSVHHIVQVWSPPPEVNWNGISR